MAVAKPCTKEEHREDILVGEAQCRARRQGTELAHLATCKATVASHDIACVERTKPWQGASYRSIDLHREVGGELVAYPAVRLEVELPLGEPSLGSELILYYRVVVEEREHGVEAQALGLVAKCMAYPGTEPSEANAVVHLPRW